MRQSRCDMVTAGVIIALPAAARYLQPPASPPDRLTLLERQIEMPHDQRTTPDTPGSLIEPLRIQSRQGPRLRVALWRALFGKCPNCGRGKLFSSYLKQVEQCVPCGERYGHIRSDDAAPWLTILIVGHVVVPVLLAVESQAAWPQWVSMTFWPTISLGMAFLVLPRAKALFLSVIWATRAPGSETE